MMTIKIKNSKGPYEKNVLDGISDALNHLDVITDDKLRSQVKDRLENTGTIFIRRTPREDNRIKRDDDCYNENPDHMGQNKRHLLMPWKPKKEIALCIYNILNGGYMEDIWMIIMHEFAHSCKWEHEHGKGVPGANGFPRRR